MVPVCPGLKVSRDVTILVPKPGPSGPMGQLVTFLLDRGPQVRHTTPLSHKCLAYRNGNLGISLAGEPEGVGRMP